MTAQIMNHETVLATDAEEAVMANYIAYATAAWWSYLSGFSVGFCRERFTTEFARGLIQDIYAREIEQGATKADAAAAAGTLMVRNTIAAVDDERAARLAAGLRDHVRASVARS